MKQRHRKRILDSRQVARIRHAYNREALMHRGMRASLTWFTRELRLNPWRKKKRIRRKLERFYGGEMWSDAQLFRVVRKPPLTINMMKLTPEGERALAAGLPIGRDGRPADQEKFGVIPAPGRCRRQQQWG